MTSEFRIRWGWLKTMYGFTVLVAGGYGLGMIFVPKLMQPTSPTCDPVNFGVLGSVYLAFGILALLGLRDPLKFVPVLVLQLVYKTIWFLGVFFPLLLTGRFPASEILTVVIFGLTVAGDLVAIPFRFVFTRRTATQGTTS